MSLRLIKKIQFLVVSFEHANVAESEIVSEIDKVSEVLHFDFLARGELVSLHQVIKGELLKIDYRFVICVEFILLDKYRC